MKKIALEILAIAEEIMDPWKKREEESKRAEKFAREVEEQLQKVLSPVGRELERMYPGTKWDNFYVPAHSSYSPEVTLKLAGPYKDGKIVGLQLMASVGSVSSKELYSYGLQWWKYTDNPYLGFFARSSKPVKLTSSEIIHLIKEDLAKRSPGEQAKMFGLDAPEKSLPAKELIVLARKHLSAFKLIKDIYDEMRWRCIEDYDDTDDAEDSFSKEIYEGIVKFEKEVKRKYPHFKFRVWWDSHPDVIVSLHEIN